MTETPEEPLPLPEVEPTTIERVVNQLRLKGGVDALSVDDLADMVDTVAAVNGWVRTLPIADGSRGAEAWPANVGRGSTMLAARLWRRRDTTGGIYSAGDIVPVFVHQRDPDVALLLNLGDYGKPSVL